MKTDLRRRLLVAVQAGCLRLECPVELRSGELSHDFIDIKRALSDGENLEIACRAIVEELDVRGIEFDAIGGLTMGADQFAYGTAIVSNKKWFVVRKEPKGRGTDGLVEGACLAPGDLVVLVDDVVTTGGSMQQAWRAVSDTGARIVAAITVVDRGGGAGDFFAHVGVPYVALLTYGDLGIAPVGASLDRTSR